MKKVTINCQYIVSCSVEIEVPNDFNFDSYEPEERISEIEDQLGIDVDDLIPEPEIFDHPTIDGIEFDMWLDVDLD